MSRHIRQADPSNPRGRGCKFGKLRGWREESARIRRTIEQEIEPIEAEDRR
jgi:hypothetical protein